MEFEYFSEKSAANLKKHGLSLDQARRLWEVPSVVVKARTVGEARFMIIGRLGGRWFSCIYTMRGETIRLISTRRSHRKEVRLYHEIIQKIRSSGGV
ncbi:MAG: BrnT family toxin [Candidatus Omnitrophica bacterium]|nr:BrnT family toxin [Candidatus Omnitrophota bacterium]